jgi:glycine dehydrogenase subunit 1
LLGEGQSLGNPISYGGPYLGFFAVKEKLLRRVPGRIAGVTVDNRDQKGFVLTLQAREQHIRRERATSNICSNQALNALAATIYLALLGPQGLREVGEQSVQKAHYTQRLIREIPGFNPVFNQPFFKEFVISTDKDITKINEKLFQNKIIGGLPLGGFMPQLNNSLLFCVTEARTKEEIDRLIQVLGEV